LTSPLDHESQRIHTLHVETSDDVNTDSSALEIFVVDENDNAPSFNQSAYFVSLFQ